MRASRIGEDRSLWRSRRRKRLGAAALAAGMLTTVTTLTTPHVVAAATSVVSLYEMNETSGSVMHDSGPYGVDGYIGSDIVLGQRYQGATGYRWPWTRPGTPPAQPERIASVASNDLHNPGTGDYAVEFRYRTTQNFGNVVQKGQNATRGGYFKFEQPSGYMTCLFKGSRGEQRAVKSPIQTNDGNWHTIRCERTDWGIFLFVDGVEVRRLRGTTGTIANQLPLSIGGKSFCDEIEVTCDYFVGDIDYVKIEKEVPSTPTNQPPNAAFSTSCDGLTCTFDGNGSSDQDGTIAAHRWTFGDGSVGVGSAVQHTYASAGTFTVTLTVTDDDGASDATTRTLNVGDRAEAITFVGGNSSTRWSSQPSVNLPGVQPGDVMVLFVSSATSASLGNPGAGWESLGTESTSRGVVGAWLKVAAAGDAGSPVSVPMSTAAKTNASVVAYRGVSPSAPVAIEASSTSAYTAARVTPLVPVPESGTWALSFWMHRDSATESLLPPAGVVTRITDTMSGGGHPTVLVADSGQPVTSGSYGGLTATADGGASSFGVTWTVLLRSS